MGFKSLLLPAGPDATLPRPPLDDRSALDLCRQFPRGRGLGLGFLGSHVRVHAPCLLSATDPPPPPKPSSSSRSPRALTFGMPINVLAFV